MSEPTSPPAGPAGASIPGSIELAGTTLTVQSSTVREVYDLVIDARHQLADRLGDGSIEGSTAVDALVALAAAVPVLDLAGQQLGDADDVSQYLARKHQRDLADQADSLADDLARALGVHIDSATDWRGLLDQVRARPVPFGPTIPVSSLAIALGLHDGERVDDWGVAQLLARVRQLVAAEPRDNDPGPQPGEPELNEPEPATAPQPLIDRDALAAGVARERLAKLVADLAEAVGAPNPTDPDWFTVGSIATLLSAVRELREGGEAADRTRARELAAALGYPTDRGALAGGWDWGRLVSEVEAQHRYVGEVSRNAVTDLARALGLDPADQQWRDMLTLVGQLARPDQLPATSPENYRQSLARVLGIDLDVESLSWPQLLEVARSRSEATGQPDDR